jgi:cell division GTPase FtsZ
MSAETKKIKIEQEIILDNIKDEAIMSGMGPNDKKEEAEIKEEVAVIDEDKLAKLKAKLAAKEDSMKPTEEKKVIKKDRTLNIGFLGSGQCGSRLAAEFFSKGYNSFVINTASQDLEFIDLPESNKLLLDNSVGGAAKDLQIGKSMAENYRSQIKALVNTNFAANDVIMILSSLGGGSGAGSLTTLIEIVAETGKPIIVCCVLPLNSDDSQTKSNSLITLSQIASMAQNKTIANLILIDNAKIESIYSDVSQLDFFELSNKVISEPLHALNKLSSMPSKIKSLDGMELIKIMLDGEGLTSYGKMVIKNYNEDETAIASSIIDHMSSNLLSDLDIKKAKYVGFAMVATESVIRSISSAALNYASSILNETCSSPNGVFRGIYIDNEMKDEDGLVIYSIFSGLDLPQKRIESLKKEVEGLNVTIKGKNEQRNLSMNVDLGEKVISKTQEIKDKISASKSTFGKFSSGIIDKRNK